DTDLALLKQLIVSGQVQIIGEVTSQYAKLGPNDPALDPLYALAQELDVPLGIHVAGIGAGTPDFRAALGDPLLLEEIPLKYPKLRLYVMHAGYPFGDRMISLMRRHPQVYVDISLIDWQITRSEFHTYLKRLIDNGFGKRIMFGTDQVSWPAAIGIAINNIESATFLSQSQKRDILYNNAARFLRLRNSRAK
ncbi:MAG: amidohydrolase family protein, partial [Sphingomonadales bacterium]|nr:amidohydrolase family protein [Sphingomonadales bacterium]